MRVALFCFSDEGAALALKLCGLYGWEKTAVHSTAGYAAKYGFCSHGKISDDMGTLFHENDALIFVGACGIATRSIAPHIKSKTEDPAVLVIDDRGRFVIPILSGHIGGANALAEEIAQKLGALPVVTTATDSHGRFSCDGWAAAHDCALSSMERAKDFSAAILTRDMTVAAEFPLPEKLPAGLIPAEDGFPDLFIGIRAPEDGKKGLLLIPRIVSVGVGCRRGISREAIEHAVKTVLAEHGIDFYAVSGVASIDVKKEEAGLLEFAEAEKLPLAFYSAGELDALDGDFSESEFVRKTVGVGCVCERAAVLMSGGGDLVVHKTALDGVTVAAAIRKWRIVF